MNTAFEVVAADEPVITGSAIHYDYPTVWVEDYQTTNRDGESVIVTDWWMNGDFPAASGMKIKKDGTPSAQSNSNLGVPMPANVQAAMDALLSKTAAASLTWTRVSPGHYDSSDGQWRIDTCDENRSRFDLYIQSPDGTDWDGEPRYSWEQVGCYPNLYSAKEGARTPEYTES